MITALLLCVGSVTASPEHPGETKDTEEQETATDLSNPQERPRLFHPTNMHPYATERALYLDPWRHGAYDYYEHSGRWGSPYPMGSRYGYNRWRHGMSAGFGYHSYLYHDPFYGMLPAPGATELSVSIGSNDYFGTSLSTSTFLSEKHNIALNVAALWETGEQWWNNQDYQSYTLSPTLYWSNETTFIYASFTYSERNYADPSTASATDASPMDRRKRSSDSGMSPFRNPIASPDQNSDTFNANFRYPGFRSRSFTDHTMKGASIGIEHEIMDGMRIGLSFESRDIERK